MFIKKIDTLLFAIFLLTGFSYSSAVSAEKDLTSNAAEYICAKAREGKKTRLAVYSFTNDAGETSSETKGYSTKIISLIIEKKEFRVIDPERVPEVISEQEKGLTGLVDPETAAETGKMIGADALVFGVSGAGSLQVRIVDAATGEIIGATLEEKSGKTKINNEDFKSAESRNKFFAAQFERNLMQTSKKFPMLYLYLTANESELTELDNTFPVKMKNLKQRIADRDPAKNKKFERRKRKLISLRDENSGFDRRIRESRTEIIYQLKEKKRMK